MKLRWHFPTRGWRSLLGLPGTLGVAGMGLGLALYVSVLQPAQQRLDAARLSASSLHERIARAGLALNDQTRPVDEQLTAFYQIFPSERDAVDWIGKIAAIAERHGLELQQVDYKVSRDKIGRLTRFQMSLPLTGEYPKVRNFLSSLRAEIPIVSLEQVEFERQKVGDPKVDAKVQLVIFLESA
jgi:Tfp pilus assembly protein PilO